MAHGPLTLDQFHVYALEWFDDCLDFYFNDQKVHTYHNESEVSLPFDKPFYLILNLAYGGAWGGTKGTDDSKLPQEFRIDYVRVYGKEAQNAPQIRETEE